MIHIEILVSAILIALVSVIGFPVLRYIERSKEDDSDLL